MTHRKTCKAGIWLWSALISTIVGSAGARAHSASDAYLTLSVDRGTRGAGSVIHGQWDIALRDLDFVMKLDDDGNGSLTWGEIRRHRREIERYAYAYLYFRSGAAECAIKPTRQLIDDHADGTYAALFFDVTCANASSTLALGYSLFFAIDPSHRGIFVMHDGSNTATAVLSPEHAAIDLVHQEPG